MGERRLDAALKHFSHKDEVEIINRCFELDPTAERKVDYDHYEKLARKYGMSRAQATQSGNNLKRQAELVGLDFHFETLKITNTFDAHRLTLYAGTHGKMAEMSERLFRAYFTDSKNIGDHETLIQLAVEVGLDSKEVAAMLEKDDFASAVRADEEEANKLQIHSVPFYVIDRKYAVSGAQSSEVFLGALEKAW